MYNFRIKVGNVQMKWSNEETIIFHILGKVFITSLNSAFSLRDIRYECGLHL